MLDLASPRRRKIKFGGPSPIKQCVPAQFPPAGTAKCLHAVRHEAGNNLRLIRVLLSNDFSEFRQRELCGAMGKETKRSPDRFDRDIRAADALELARLMPPGPERNGALKLCARV